MGPPSQETERFRGSKVHFEAIFLGNFPNEKTWEARKFSSNALLPCTDVILSWSPAAQWSKEFFSHGYMSL